MHGAHGQSQCPGADEPTNDLRTSLPSALEDFLLDLDACILW